MKCVLVSFFNSKNLGDILIGTSLEDMISKQFTLDKISYSGLLEVTGNTPSTSYNNNSFKSKILKIMKNNGLGSFVNFYYNNLKNIDLEIFEKKISAAEVLVIGGGNMIFDLDRYSSSASRFNKFVSIAKKNGVKIFAISLGIGPFQTKKQALNAVRALEICDYISFRDKASYEIFKKYNKTHQNVHISVDPVFLFPHKITFKKDNTDFVGLNIINNKLLIDSNEEYYDSINQYKKLAEGLAENLNKKVVLFSTELSDYEAVEDVYNLTKHNNQIGIRYISTVDELFEFYSEISVLVGTRMHSMIIALTQGIPVVGLSWQQKVNSLFEIINSPDLLFPYKDMEASMLTIIKSVDNIYRDLDKEKIRINAMMETIKTKNEINIELLELLQNN